MSKASKELIEKRSALMKQFNEFRQKKQAEWAEQRARRLELRNRKLYNIQLLYSLCILYSNHSKIIYGLFNNAIDLSIVTTVNYYFLDVDTDSLESDSTNVEEEVVEFLIKEETTVIE